MKLIDRRQLSLMVVWATLIAVADLAQALEIRKFDVHVKDVPGLIYWQGNHTLIVKGSSNYEAMVPPRKREWKLAKVNVETAEVEWFDAFTGLFCINGEELAYFTDNRDTRPASDPDDRFWVSRGQVGKVTTQEVSRQYLSTFDFNYSCRPESELPPMPEWMEEAKKQGRIFRRLRPEHGWLEWGVLLPPDTYKSQAHYPIRLYRPNEDAHEGISLGDALKKRLDKATEIDLSLTYVQHKGAYLLRTRHYVVPIKPGIKATLWWLFPDGRLEELTSFTRGDDWPFVYLYSVYSTKTGVLFAGEEHTRNTMSYLGESGLYRIRGNKKPERLLKGRIGAVQVSPDGCKVAFGNDTRWEVTDNLEYKLQVIDVCTER